MRSPSLQFSFYARLVLALSLLLFILVTPNSAVAQVELEYEEQVVDTGAVGRGEFSDTCRPEGTETVISVLFLLDYSLSLVNRDSGPGSDPDGQRITATEYALEELSSLSESQELKVLVRVDGFAGGYVAGEWREASDIPSLRSELLSVSVPENNADSTSTDYLVAVNGARQAFLETDQNTDCKIMVWFTDGGHTGDASLSEICANARLVAEQNIWTLAVRLSAFSLTDFGSAVLPGLFGHGENAGDCTAPGLIGSLNTELNINDLVSTLSNTASEAVSWALALSDNARLPGENISNLQELVVRGGIGIVNSECWTEVDIAENTVGFRVLLDSGIVARGIDDPSRIRLGISPPGAGADRFIIPQETVWNDIVEFAHELTRTNSIIGAASRNRTGGLTEIAFHRELQSEYGFTGVWRFWFWGDSTYDGENACKVGAYYSTSDESDALPYSDLSGSMDNNGVLTLIASRTSESRKYMGTQLRLTLTDKTGRFPLYPGSDGSFNWCLEVPCGDINVLDGVPGQATLVRIEAFFDALTTDAIARGGLHILERGVEESTGDLRVSVELNNVLEVAGHRLEWVTDAGNVSLKDSTRNLIADRRDWEKLNRWASSQGADPFYAPEATVAWDGLPIVLKDAQGEIGLEISPTSGALNGVIEVDPELGWTVTVQPNNNPESEPVTFTLPFSPNNEDWKCEVAGILARGIQMNNCPVLVLDAGSLIGLLNNTGVFEHSSDDTTDDTLVSLSINTTLRSSNSPIEDTLATHLPPANDCDVLQPGDCAIARERSRQTMKSLVTTQVETQKRQVNSRDRNSVVVEVTVGATIAPPSQTSEEAQNVSGLLWGLLIAGVVLLLRTLAALHLSRWEPLDTSDYVVIEIPDGNPIPQSTQTSPKLITRNKLGTVGPVVLATNFKEIWFGKSRKIRATSIAGPCIGPSGWETGKDGRSVGIVGTRLQHGWVIVMRPMGEPDWLVAWDLPSNPDIAAVSIRSLQNQGKQLIEEWEQDKQQRLLQTGSGVTPAHLLSDEWEGSWGDAKQKQTYEPPNDSL